MPSDVAIPELLAGLGFGDPQAQAAARAALEKAGLTNARKARVSQEKVPRIRQLLDQAFARSCGSPACDAVLSARKPSAARLAVLDARNCENCGGSDNRKALERLAAACRKRSVSRVVVVGGSPSVRAELAEMGAPFQLRLIDGTERRTSDRARADLEWAELVLVWGSSELDHKVSRLYTDVPPALKRKVVLLAKRGIAALLSAGAEHLERGG